MDGKIQMESIDLRTTHGTTKFVIVDGLKFVHEDDNSFMSIYFTGSCESDDWLDDVDCNIFDSADLECEALKWIIRNVEVVDKVVEKEG